MPWCYGADLPHWLSVTAFLALCAVFALILSDVCGEPWWYDRRIYAPKIDEGNLQFLSEHIMRCKYSTETHWHVLPWSLMYLFTFSLVQTLYTWVRLNMLLRLQRAHLHGSDAEPYSKVHVFIAAALVVSSLVLCMVVEFDHEYLPEDPTDRESPIVWKNRIYPHYVGVLMLLGGYIAVHIPIAYLYVMQLYSQHDYSVVCESGGGEACAYRPAQARRGVYVGSEILFTLLCMLFLVFWAFSMNDSAVATEYALLAAFLLIAVLDGVMSLRMRHLYAL